MCPFFIIGMVYIRRYLVNPNVQRVQNMYGNVGLRVSKAELRPLIVKPYFKREKIPRDVLGKPCRP